MTTPRDLVLARRAKRAGARPALRIIMEARRAKLPLYLAFGIVHQESEFKNVIGHDKGQPFAGQPVTRARVVALIDRMQHGGKGNGIGLTQLTSLPWVMAAERLGGAHIEKNQLRATFEGMSDLVRAHGVRGGLATYNGGHPSSAKGQAYARKVLEKAAHWHQVLDPPKKKRR